MKQDEDDLCRKQRVDLTPDGLLAIVSVGRHQKYLHLSNAFAGLDLYDGYRDYPPKKHSFRVSSCGRVSGCGTLSVNARIRMTSRNGILKKRSLNLIPSQNQSQSPTLNQTTGIRSSASLPTSRS